jgi:hypothetical protein
MCAGGITGTIGRMGCVGGGADAVVTVVTGGTITAVVAGGAVTVLVAGRWEDVDVVAGASVEDDEVDAGGGCTVAEVEGTREEVEGAKEEVEVPE